MSEQKDSIPLSGSPDKERKQQNPLPPGETPQRPDLLATIYKPHVRGDKFSWWDIVHSKRAWTVFVILLFLSYFFTAIPVEKVPVLRNLAYLMGYTREETKTFSFLKTLVTLPQRYKARRAEKEDWEITRKSSAAAIAASTEEALLYKAQLIDFKQSRQGTNPRGQDSDQLQKIRQANTARASRVVAMASVQREDPAAVQTEQKSAGNEVFFGTQEGTLPLDPTAGFDTTQKLAALPSPGIVDSHKTDKLLEAAESFYSRTTNIDFQNKLVDHTVGSRTVLQDVESPDDKKPKVDVVYAWLTSRAAKRTENKMLKKTLAAASFIGADLTRPMLLTSLDGTGTVAVDPRQIDIDISVAKDRVEREEKCTDYLTEKEGDYEKKILDPIKEMNDKLDKYISNFPNTCNEVGSLSEINGPAGGKASTAVSFANSASSLCKKVSENFKEVEDTCKIKVNRAWVENGPAAQCSVGNMIGGVSNVVMTCRKAYAACADRWNKANVPDSRNPQNTLDLTDTQRMGKINECRGKVRNAKRKKFETDLGFLSGYKYASDGRTLSDEDIENVEDTDIKERVRKDKEGEEGGGNTGSKGLYSTVDWKGSFLERSGLDWATSSN